MRILFEGINYEGGMHNENSQTIAFIGPSMGAEPAFGTDSRSVKEFQQISLSPL